MSMKIHTTNAGATRHVGFRPPGKKPADWQEGDPLPPLGQVVGAHFNEHGNATVSEEAGKALIAEFPHVKKQHVKEPDPPADAGKDEDPPAATTEE